MVRNGTWIALLLATAAMAAGCGTGSGVLDAGDELDLGVRAARRGYWQEALHRFELAHQRDPQNAKVLNDMAIALEATGRYEEALVTYQTALQVDPRDRRIRKNYEQFRTFYEQHVARQEVEESEDGGAQEANPAEEGSDGTSDG